MTLFQYLNNKLNYKANLKHIDTELNKKDFWKNDEKKYQEVILKIEEEHKEIMSPTLMSES